MGIGADLTTKQLAELVQFTVGDKGVLEWASNKPNATPRKLMDIGRLNSKGWKVSIVLEEEISKNYTSFLDNQ